MGNLSDYYDEMKENNNWDQADEYYRTLARKGRVNLMRSYVRSYLTCRILEEKDNRHKDSKQRVQFFQQELDDLDVHCIKYGDIVGEEK